MGKRLIGFLFFLLALVNQAHALDCRIFLVPGALGAEGGGSSYFIQSDHYFREYADYFRAQGCEVGRAEFPEDLSVEARGLMLRTQFPRFDRGRGSVILAHSEGGVDVRYALATLGLYGVKGVLNVGVPHRGTPVADWVVEHAERKSLLFWLLKLGNYDLRALAFAPGLRGSFLEKHAKNFAPVPGVYYGSAVADCQSDCHWSLRLLRWWMGFKDGDGMVPAESQRFGEDLGTYDLDHLSTVDTDVKKRPERLRLLERFMGVVKKLQ